MAPSDVEDLNTRQSFSHPQPQPRPSKVENIDIRPSMSTHGPPLALASTSTPEAGIYTTATPPIPDSSAISNSTPTAITIATSAVAQSKSNQPPTLTHTTTAATGNTGGNHEQAKKHSNNPSSAASSHSSNIVGVHYRVGKKIGEGSFGVIYEGAFFHLGGYFHSSVVFVFEFLLAISQFHTRCVVHSLCYLTACVLSSPLLFQSQLSFISFIISSPRYFIFIFASCHA